MLRPSHCPECRNEQRWKPHVDVYIISPPYQRAYCSKPKRTVYNTPCRASPLLGSWHSVWSCEVLTRQNQSVQLRLNMYMSPRPPALWGLSARVTVAKIVIISISCIKKWRFFFMNAKLFRFLFVFVDFCNYFSPLFYLMQSWCPTNIFCDFDIFLSKHLLFQIILVSLQVICGVRCRVGIIFVECCNISLILICRERNR